MTSTKLTSVMSATKKGKGVWIQPAIGAIILLVFALVGPLVLNDHNTQNTLFLFTGIALGYFLQRAYLGFAGTVRKPMMGGDTRLTKAVIILFALLSVVVFSLKVGGVIKFDQNIKGAGIGGVVGGFIFGVGMIFAGACASGILTDIGTGAVPAFIALMFFLLGTGLGEASVGAWDHAALKHGFNLATMHEATTIATADVMNAKTHMMNNKYMIGYVITIIVQLVVFAMIYAGVNLYKKKLEREKRLNEPTYEAQCAEDAFHFDNKVTGGLRGFYFKWIGRRTTLMVSVIAVFLILAFIQMTTKKAWGVTTEYAIWSGWMGGHHFQDFINGSSGVNGKHAATFAKGFVAHAASWRNIGILVGSLISVLMANKFTFGVKSLKNWKTWVFFPIGGLLLGYGARIAHGCNAGALLGGITNFSLHGWIFGITMVAGGIVGVLILRKFKYNG